MYVLSVAQVRCVGGCRWVRVQVGARDVRQRFAARLVHLPAGGHSRVRDDDSCDGIWGPSPCLTRPSAQARPRPMPAHLSTWRAPLPPPSSSLTVPSAPVVHPAHSGSKSMSAPSISPLKSCDVMMGATNGRITLAAVLRLTSCSGQAPLAAQHPPSQQVGECACTQVVNAARSLSCMHKAALWRHEAPSACMHAWSTWMNAATAEVLRPPQPAPAGGSQPWTKLAPPTLMSTCSLQGEGQRSQHRCSSPPH